MIFWLLSLRCRRARTHSLRRSRIPFPNEFVSDPERLKRRINSVSTTNGVCCSGRRHATGDRFRCIVDRPWPLVFRMDCGAVAGSRKLFPAAALLLFAGCLPVEATIRAEADTRVETTVAIPVEATVEAPVDVDADLAAKVAAAVVSSMTETRVEQSGDNNRNVVIYGGGWLATAAAFVVLVLKYRTTRRNSEWVKQALQSDLSSAQDRTDVLTRVRNASVTIIEDHDISVAKIAFQAHEDVEVREEVAGAVAALGFSKKKGRP